jgi:hypothetical protein
MIKDSKFGLLNLKQSNIETDDNNTSDEFLSFENEAIALPKNKGGRPSLKYGKESRRAYVLWLVAKELPSEQRKKISNRKLIQIAQTMQYRALFSNCTFKTLEESISRGKTALEIDDEWNSKVCKKLFEDIRKLQP